MAAISLASFASTFWGHSANQVHPPPKPDKWRGPMAVLREISRPMQRLRSLPHRRNPLQSSLIAGSDQSTAPAAPGPFCGSARLPILPVLLAQSALSGQRSGRDVVLSAARAPTHFAARRFLHRGAPPAGCRTLPDEPRPVSARRACALAAESGRICNQGKAETPPTCGGLSICVRIHITEENARWIAGRAAPPRTFRDSSECRARTSAARRPYQAVRAQAASQIQAETI